MLESLNLFLITNPVLGVGGGINKLIKSVGDMLGETGKNIAFTGGALLLVVGVVFLVWGILGERSRKKLVWSFICFIAGGALVTPKGWDLLKNFGSKNGVETFEEAFGS